MNTSHPNILKLTAVDIDPRNGTFSLISELMLNGNIMGYIRVAKTNRIRLVRQFLPLTNFNLSIPKLEDVTRGLRYLHKCGIVHGDLKGVSL